MSAQQAVEVAAVEDVVAAAVDMVAVDVPATTAVKKVRLSCLVTSCNDIISY